MKPNETHQKYYQGMYNVQVLENERLRVECEELRAHCNVYAGIALFSILFAILALLLVGVIVYG